MNNKYDCCPTTLTDRTSLIQNLLDTLTEENHLLADTVSNLENRIGSVCTPTCYPKDPDGNPVDVPLFSQIAERIKSCTERVTVQRQRVQFIINNLEI